MTLPHWVVPPPSRAVPETGKVYVSGYFTPASAALTEEAFIQSSALSAAVTGALKSFRGSVTLKLPAVAPFQVSAFIHK
jgi:hypothetical protein